MMLFVSLAFAHDFSSIQGTVPRLPAVDTPEAGQALQLMVLPFMPDADRYAALSSLQQQTRSDRVDKVFQQCDAAFRDGIRPGETGFAGAAKRQEKGIVFDCIDASVALGSELGIEALRGPAAEAFAPAASQPRFGAAKCPALLNTLDVTSPGPEQPKKLEKRGEHGPWGSAVVHIDGTGVATVQGRLYGDEAASKACWAAVDGPWKKPVDRTGKPTENCFHLRCAW